MQIARVKGTVISTNKTEKLYGLKLLIVVPIDLSTFQEKGQPVVAIDTVGAGVGEVVMLCGGSSSRQTPITENKPSDMAIVAIIDSIELNGEVIFRKFEEQANDKT
jgi:ethanolamine utilization protein EutN/carbon dioxide concentrating mechanism protein CcmL